MSLLKHPCAACGEHLTRAPLCPGCEVKYQIFVAMRPNKVRAAMARDKWAARQKKAKR